MKQDKKTHKLVASPKTVHTGFFDAALPPVLTIESGDTVVMNSLTLLDGQLRSGMTLDEVMAARQKICGPAAGTAYLDRPYFRQGGRAGRRPGNPDSKIDPRRKRGELSLSRENWAWEGFPKIFPTAR